MKISTKGKLLLQSQLPDECEFIILGKANNTRYHSDMGTCKKEWIKSEWVGNCALCELKKGYFLTCHVYDVLLCNEERIQLKMNGELATIIGDEIGPFCFVRKKKGYFSSCKESRFLP